MDYVFIDTSVFISENFLEGKRIREIYRLAQEGHLQLILPEITYQELLSRIKKNFAEAISGYKAFREKTKIIRNLPSLESRFDKIDEEKYVAELQQLFIDKLKTVRTIIIEYPELNIGPVFQKYFDNLFPFGGADKKHEFPDAFALVTLEKWSVEHKTKCLVVAGDKDISQYNSDRFITYPSITNYLDVILRKVEQQQHEQKRLAIVNSLFQKHREQFEAEIEQWLDDQLTDEASYRKFSYPDIHNIEIIDSIIDLEDFQITSTSNNMIMLISNAEIDFEVELEMDDLASGWYDDEERKWHHTDREKEIVKKHKILPISILVEFPIAGDQYADIRITGINFGKGLEI